MFFDAPVSNEHTLVLCVPLSTKKYLLVHRPHFYKGEGPTFVISMVLLVIAHAILLTFPTL